MLLIILQNNNEGKQTDMQSQSQQLLFKAQISHIYNESSFTIIENLMTIKNKIHRLVFFLFLPSCSTNCSMTASDWSGRRRHCNPPI